MTWMCLEMLNTLQMAGYHWGLSSRDYPIRWMEWEILFSDPDREEDQRAKNE